MKISKLTLLLTILSTNLIVLSGERSSSPVAVSDPSVFETNRRRPSGGAEHPAWTGRPRSHLNGPEADLIRTVAANLGRPELSPHTIGIIGIDMAGLTRTDSPEEVERKLKAATIAFVISSLQQEK